MLGQQLKESNTTRQGKYIKLFIIIVEEKSKDWHIEYLKECDRKRTLPLAEVAMKGMRSNEYHLFNYQMNDGLARALAKSLASSITEEKLQCLAFVENGLSDS